MPSVYKRGNVWWGKVQRERRVWRRSLRTGNRAEAVRRLDRLVQDLDAEGFESTRATARLLTMEDVAGLLRVSRRTLQDILREHPYYRVVGRAKRFTKDDFERLLEALRFRTRSVDAGESQTGTSAAPSEAALWTRLRALTTERPPRRPTSEGKRRPRP